MPDPNFENLFGLSDPSEDQPYRGQVDRHGEMLDLLRGQATTDQSIIVTWAMGADCPDDIVWTTSGAPLIVHARLIDLFEQNHFTGWSTYPIELHTKSGKLLPDYFGLSILGRCGSVDLSQSTVELRQYPGGWVPHFRGHFFQPQTWDGSDFFMEDPDHLGMVSACCMITKNVQRTLVKADINNIALCPLSEISVSTNIYTIGLKHLLPPDFQQRLQATYDHAGVPRPAWV